MAELQSQRFWKAGRAERSHRPVGNLVRGTYPHQLCMCKKAECTAINILQSKLIKETAPRHLHAVAAFLLCASEPTRSLAAGQVPWIKYLTT